MRLRATLIDRIMTVCKAEGAWRVLHELLLDRDLFGKNLKTDINVSFINPKELG